LYKLNKNYKKKKMTKHITIILVFTIIFCQLYSQTPAPSNNITKENSLIKLGRVKYSGGGDWYNDPSGEVNLLNFIKSNTNIPVEATFSYVDLASDNLFAYPIIFLTGHGNMNLTTSEVNNLRRYLENGGFLYIDDDYGLYDFARREMKKIFPDQQFAELPYNHELFHCHFKFPNGVPKTHEHDNKPAQTFGLFSKGRLCVVLTFESNPSDGWADAKVHNDPEEKRLEALKFGTNIVVWALEN
jgi:hypothetical protein